MHKGFPVDEEVWLTRNGVAEGEDDVVKRAVAWINGPGVAEGQPQLPSQFTLSQNYPNPFNPRTVVRSQLPEASHVKIVVYDVLGREVAVLVNERRTAGSYQDVFDGNGMASGVYIYRLTAGTFTQTGKMVLVK